MAMIDIERSVQSFRIFIEPNGVLKNTHLNISELFRNLVIFRFDSLINRWVADQKFRYYDRSQGKLYLPLFELSRFIEFLNQHRHQHQIKDLTPVMGKVVQIPIKAGVTPKSELQAQAIDYIGQADLTIHVRPIALQTGFGKSASAILGISKIGRRGMIGTPSLLNQWEKAIYQFTDLKKEDVYIVQGMPSLAKLLHQIDKSLFPKIILVSTPTLRSYGDGSDAYMNFPPFDELCERLDVGVRVTDEVHWNFHLNFQLDLRLNSSIVIPLSATFDNSSKEVLKILDGHYTKEIRFGEEHYKRYTDITAFAYPFVHGEIPENAYRSRDGYSQIKFEGWLLQKKGKSTLRELVSQIYYPIVNQIYTIPHKPGDKCLILCATQEMCRYLRDDFQKEYPNKKVELYIHGTSDDVLSDNDIIISTLKSAGTGRDIPGLFAVLNTASIHSSTQNKQNLGRLRELKDGRTPHYAYCYCVGIPSHIRHAEHRAYLFERLGRTFKTVRL